MNALQFQHQRADVLTAHGHLDFGGVFHGLGVRDGMAERTDAADPLGQKDDLDGIALAAHKLDATMDRSGADRRVDDALSLDVEPCRNRFLESHVRGTDGKFISFGHHGTS